MDTNHNGLISVQEASNVNFQRMIGGNLSLILTQQNVENGTKSPKSEYNPNNDTYINIETELKPVLIQQSQLFFLPSRSLSSYNQSSIIV